MRAVTKRFIAALFTAAPGDAFVGVEGHLHRPHAGIFAGMRAVTKRLFLRFPACTPKIISGLHFQNERLVLLGAHITSLRVSLRDTARFTVYVINRFVKRVLD